MARRTIRRGDGTKPGIRCRPSSNQILPKFFDKDELYGSPQAKQAKSNLEDCSDAPSTRRSELPESK
jgi:hypothetical protein